MVHDDKDTGVPDLSNRELLRVLMQEIVDVSRELKEDIMDLDQKLSGKIDTIDQKLTGRIDSLSSAVKVLRLEVHQNHASFIKRQNDLEKRVNVLEAQVV